MSQTIATADTSFTLTSDEKTQSRTNRYRQAAYLLRQWRNEDDGYDQKIWPLLKEELGNLRTRCRE